MLCREGARDGIQWLTCEVHGIQASEVWGSSEWGVRCTGYKRVKCNVHGVQVSEVHGVQVSEVWGVRGTRGEYRKAAINGELDSFHTSLWLYSMGNGTLFFIKIAEYTVYRILYEVNAFCSILNPAVGSASQHNSMPVPSPDKWWGKPENPA